MSLYNEADWKKQYSTAIERNRDWRDLFALVSGRKGRPSQNYVRKELYDNKDRILDGLKYFQTQEEKPPLSRENRMFNDCGAGWSKERKNDITAPFLMNKLHLMTGMESALAWEVLSNYLQHAFRGPPNSLQKLLAQNEEKSQAVVADLFCFYYRERMFILKILYHILTNPSGDFYSGIFSEFIRDNVKFPELYESLFKQLKTVSEAHSLNLSCLSHLSAPRYALFWTEHNLRERIQLIKLIIVTIKHCQQWLPPMERIKEVLELIEGLKSLEKAVSRSKEQPFKTLRKFLVTHIIQLIGFDVLSGEDEARWNNKEVFSAINEKIMLMVDRKVEEGTALLAIWFIVHVLTPLGTSCPNRRELIAHTVKSANPWIYFYNTLTCPDILDDKSMSKAVHYAIYQVAFLSVVNVGLDYVRYEEFQRLVALLVRDAAVLKHFWMTEHDGLQLVLRECESFFPVVWRPVLDIYTAVASHGESYVNEIEKRVEREVSFTQLQTRMIHMESLGGNVFRTLEPVQPFISQAKIVIPAGTRCIVSGETEIYIHWNFSVSIWHVIKETLYKWSQKMTQHPKPPEEELTILRNNVISLLGFYNEILNNRKEPRKITFFAVDEMFSRIELYHERKDSEMLDVCLKTCTLLLNHYPKDILVLLEVARVIPDIDKVMLDHVQCAKGAFYHSNGIKTILELVELNSGKFTVLVSYLEFILKLFELPTVFESWVALAGVQFVLRDVFPHYNRWVFSEERQRVHIQWLCVRIISCVLDVTFDEISPAQTSVIQQVDVRGKQPLNCVLPTKNLFANTALHHLLNWEPAIALIHVISIGDQQLFSWVESFHCWDSQCCTEILSSVHIALSILNKCILYKHVHNDGQILSRLEREIYKEPKETDTYRVVINVAGYVYNFLSPDLRFNAVKLISRFADNRHQSLMACIGMEANSMRQMYLKPLYSSNESETIKVAVLELVTDCIHKQASLAEAFLNALELKECVQKEEGEESEGFVHIALSIIRKRKDTPNDRAYLASVQLLHALWHERRTLVISYIRMRNDFFPNFCHPLVNITKVQSEVVPAYAYILTCVGTELYWYKEQVHSALLECINDLFKNEHIIRLSLYCTDQLRGMAPEECTDAAPTHTSDSTKILIAWKEFLYVLVKTFPDKLNSRQKQILCIHTLNALANEISREGNMVAVSTLAELYLLLLTTFQLQDVKDENFVALKKMSSIVTQVAHHYNFFSEVAVCNILASCCRFFMLYESNTSAQVDAKNTEWSMHMERIIRAVCELVVKELQVFSLETKNSKGQSRHSMPPLLCLAVTLGQVVGGTVQWRQTVTQYHLISQLVRAAAIALQMKQSEDSSLLMLQLLTVLAQGERWQLGRSDLLELHAVWDALKPPIHNLSASQVYHQERSVFDVTNWYPVYMRALSLVSALVDHHCPDTRQLGFDFLSQHDRFICDIFEFKDDSLKENATELITSALRLIRHVIQVIVPWDWKLKTILARIIVKIKQFVGSLVDLLGDPDCLLRRWGSAQGQGQPIALAPEPTHLLQLQSRLVGLLLECLSVLQTTCPLPGDVLSADRIGLPPSHLKLTVAPTAPSETGPEFHTLINLINLVAKRLASNLRYSPRTSVHSGSTSESNKSTSETSKNAQKDSTCTNQMKEDSYLAAKLSGCNQNELKLVLERSVHYLITNTLLTILSEQMGFHESVIFVRDLSTEAKILFDYNQRLKYGKESITDWYCKTDNPEGYKPLTWNQGENVDMEDSMSLGCASLPDADSDSDSVSRISFSSSTGGRRSKKVKLNQSQVPTGLLHYLPNSMQFDPNFEATNRETKDRRYRLLPQDDDVPDKFILFCNHFLKQMFGMHNFDERLLRGGL